MTRILLSKVTLWLTILWWATTQAFAMTTTFNTGGTSGSYTVPAGITRVEITAKGADGGLLTNAAETERPGEGATVTYVVNVTAGDIIRFVVGAKGANGDFEGGGGGGTGVFLNSTLIMVAGGGGGADNTGNGGGGVSTTTGGAGLTTGPGGSGGAGGVAGAGGAAGIGVVGDGSGGGGGILSAGGNVTTSGGSLTTGGAAADTDPITGGLTGSAGGTSNQTTDPSGADGRGTSGGAGFGGGGAGSHREAGGGGGYSGGGGGGSGGSPGGGGSFENATLAGRVSAGIVAGGIGTGLDGFVRIRTTTITVRKISSGAVGTFNFNLTNTVSPNPNSVSVVTTATTPAAFSSATIGLAAFSTVTDIVESDPTPSGFTLTTINCTGLNGGTANTTLGTTRRARLNDVATAPGNDIVCTFTNTATGPVLVLTKSASPSGPLTVGTVVNYTYSVRNIGVQTASNVNVLDVHNGAGTLPVPASEGLVTDIAPIGDTTDATPNNGIWSSLGVGDTVRFTAPYTVTQQDINALQ
jgi:hypothetical protein